MNFKTLNNDNYKGHTVPHLEKGDYDSQIFHFIVRVLY